MEVSYPICITSRLRAGVKIGESEISIAFDGMTDDGRRQYKYWLDLKTDDTVIEHYGEDLASGIERFIGKASLQAGLRDLLSFMKDCGESYWYAVQTCRDVEDYVNGSLFPLPVAEWCYLNSDELSILSCELEENPGLIAGDNDDSVIKVKGA